MQDLLISLVRYYLKKGKLSKQVVENNKLLCKMKKQLFNFSDLVLYCEELAWNKAASSYDNSIYNVLSH